MNYAAQRRIAIHIARECEREAKKWDASSPHVAGVEPAGCTCEACVCRAMARRARKSGRVKRDPAGNWIIA